MTKQEPNKNTVRRVMVNLDDEEVKMLEALRKHYINMDLSLSMSNLLTGALRSFFREQITNKK